MRCLQRNKREFYYSLYSGKEMPVDSDGYKTGEPVVSYSTPVAMKANISAATGMTNAEMFGTDVDYDRVIVTEDMNCPIDENTILYVDVPPTSPHDYIVKRVAKSLNVISYAISKVKVSVSDP